MPDRQPVIWRASHEGHALGWLGAVILYKAISEETDQRYTLSYNQVGAWSGPLPQIQTHEEKGYFVLSGELTFTAGNRTIRLREGGFLNVTPGTVHQFVNSSERVASLLTLHAPGAFDRFQFEAGYPLGNAFDLVPPVSNLEFERIKLIAPRYGIVLSPPPESFHQLPRCTIAHADEGLRVDILGDRYRFLTVGPDTHNRYTLVEAILSPKSTPPAQVHSREEKGIYVLEGNVTLLIEDKVISGDPHTFVHLPVGVPHAIVNPTNEAARVLMILAPSGLENLYFEAGDAIADPATTFVSVTQAGIDRLLAKAPKYGITFYPSSRM